MFKKRVLAEYLRFIHNTDCTHKIRKGFRVFFLKILSFCKVVEVNQLQRGPSSCPRAPGSVELSSESEEPEAQEELDANEKPDKEQDLQAQV